MKKYDIIIIGAGSGGLSVGLFMARLQLKVLMIDRNAGRIGGECLNDGCVPSKALIHVAGLIGNAKKAVPFGFSVSGHADMKTVREYIRERQTIIRQHEDAQHLKTLGIDFVAGEAAFADARRILVDEELYSAPRIVLATGSKPVSLNVPGLENIPTFSNETIFDLEEIPPQLTVVGAGATGLEMAQAFQRLGSQVTVIDQKDLILSSASPDVSGVLRERLELEGVIFLTRAKLLAVTTDRKLLVQDGSGVHREIYSDGLFVAMGRTYDFRSLQLQKAGIKTEAGKIVCDEYLRTTNPHVWVCGDVAGSLLFSHAAEQHARLLLNNFFSPFKKRLNNDQMSWVVFTDPEVAAFGLSELQLTERHIPFQKLSLDFTADDRAVTDDRQYGQVHICLSQKSFLKKQVILGGMMICPGAGEMIQELILAMNTKMSVVEILKKIYAYPVSSRVNQAIVAGYKSKQLTPMIRGLLRRIYRFG